MQYLAYSQPPTSVAEAHKADFLEPGVDSVVQIKHNVIELHVLVASGLRLALSGTIQGVVLKAIPVRLRSHRTSGLAVLTTTYQLFVIVFDKTSSQIKTLASHSVYERGAVKSVDLVALLAGSTGEASAPTPFLALHAFQGLVRIITLNSSDKNRSEDDSKKADEQDQAAEALDLTRGFVTRIPELLLNAMCLLPTPAGQPPRLATIHSNRHGQRVFHTHAVNFSARCLDTYEPGSFDSPASSFSPSSGIILFDADSQLMIPVRSTIAEGVIVVGSESGLFFSTASPSKSHGKRKSVSSAPGASLQDTAMEVDEVPEMQSISPKSKGKGRSEDSGSLTMSPATDSTPLLPASSRRRSSASSAQAPLATSPTSPKMMDSRVGGKRKLSDAANSSGRGKNPTRTRSGSTMANLPVECKLPISEYVAYCALADSDTTWILADGWGQAMYLRLSPAIGEGESFAGPSSSGTSAALASSPPLASSPTNGSQLQGRRPSRTSSGRMKDPLPVQLTVDPISKGRFSSPTALLDLGGGFIYVGSHFGDSLLVRISNGSRSQAAFPQTPRGSQMQLDDADSASATPSIDIVNTYTNLAPIVDFCLVETQSGQGPSHLVACSGGKNDGTLRIVRHGVAILELASLDMEGVQKVFPLQLAVGEEWQDVLVVSSISDTRVLALSAGEDGGIEELEEFDAFDLSRPTIHACSYKSRTYQVTSTGVVGGNSSWTAPASTKVTLASGHEQYLLLAVSGGDLYLLDLSQDSGDMVVAQALLEQEAACLDLSLVPTSKGASTLVAAVGLWNAYAVILLEAPSLQIQDRIEIDTTFLLRSVLSASLGDSSDGATPHLFVGLGDGSLVSYAYRTPFTDAGIIDKSTRKSVTLGSRPITLTKFKTAGNQEAGVSSSSAVLAISDRSTVVSAAGNKLIYSSVNTKDIGTAAALSTSSFPNSLLVANADTLTIGRVEQLEKHDVQTLRLGEEAPRRVSYSRDMRAYGVGFLRETLDRTSGDITRASTFKILGEDSFEVLLDFALDRHEEARSVACLSLPENEGSTEHREYFAVGTAFIEPEEEESTRGRVLLFSHSVEGGFALAGETQTRGAVHSIGQLPNGRFAASSNSEVIVFSWNGYALTHLASWGATFIAYSLAIKDNLICVVDPLRSASLIRWQEKEKRLSDVGKEFSAYGLFAAAFLRTDEESQNGKKLDTIIAADLDLNLFTAKNVPITVNDNPMAFVLDIFTLKVQARIHSGDVINKFAPGSLVPAFSRSADGPIPQVIFATSVGSIGMVATLPQSTSTTLSAVERNLRKVLESSDGNYNIGGLSQEGFRAFKAEYRTQPAAGFIDGTLLETLLALDERELDTVLQGTSDYEKLSIGKAEIVQLVEELQRMH